MIAASGYDKRRIKREADRQRALAGETLAAFHARETAKPPTLAEVFARNHVNRERCPKTPDMLRPDLAEVRRLYVETDMPNKDISARFGHAANWVNILATRNRWPLRKHNRPHVVTPAQKQFNRPHAHKARSIAQVYKDQKAEQDGRDRELYGGIVEDVAELRRAGFVVTREADKVLVGNRLCTFAEVVDLAARERRLRAPATSFFGGAAA